MEALTDTAGKGASQEKNGSQEMSMISVVRGRDMGGGGRGLKKKSVKQKERNDMRKLTRPFKRL